MPGVVTLLERLERYLLLHAAATVALTIRFREGAVTRPTLPLRQRFQCTARDWQRLLTVKLERQAVAHEVSRIELRCAGIEPMQFANVDLFDRSQQRDRQWAALAAMVRLRLGERSMRPALVNQGHPCRNPSSPVRRCCDPGNQPAGEPAVDRADIGPTWLVDPPRALSARTHGVCGRACNCINRNGCMRTGHSPTAHRPSSGFYVASAPPMIASGGCFASDRAANGSCRASLADRRPGDPCCRSTLNCSAKKQLQLRHWGFTRR